MKWLKRATGAAQQAVEDESLRERVRHILKDVETSGDDAVRRYSEEFDAWSPESFRLSPDEVESILASVEPQVIDDIRWVQRQVREFAERQRETLLDLEVETLPGVFLGHRHVPIEAAGAYVPGGRYPLVASAHMTIVTAKVAGVARVTACTPPIRGEIPRETVAAMALAGADEIWLLGGVQALGAMAYGTATMKPVHMIAGPGNAYVAEAKRQLLGQVGIDLVAGPTEILVVADDSASAVTVAVDLLSQAEHGPDSPAVLMTTSVDLATEVLALIDRLLPTMPTRDFAEPAWRDFGEVVVCDSLPEAFALADEYAFEHVEILTRDPRRALDEMRHYGALFLGEGTCVSYGDKVIGTNHVLPTRKAARYTGGLWVGKYLRTVTYQEVTDPVSSAQLGLRCGRASRVELFEGHARSGDVRAMQLDGGAPEWLSRAGI
jgi:sulfopropanediol 3-dehydrogenase